LFESSYMLSDPHKFYNGRESFFFSNQKLAVSAESNIIMTTILIHNSIGILAITINLRKCNPITSPLRYPACGY
jgi:hypothetical protein